MEQQQPFTAGQIFQGFYRIHRAELDLGKLTAGQKSDLLLDNLSWLSGSDESHRFVAHLDALQADVEANRG